MGTSSAASRFLALSATCCWLVVCFAGCDATLLTREVALDASSELMQTTATGDAAISTYISKQHGRHEHPVEWRTMHHRSLIDEITLNHKRVSFSDDDSSSTPQIPMWSNATSGNNKALRAVVTLHEHLTDDIRHSSIGFIALRHHNASATDANAATLRLQNDSGRLWMLLDFEQLKTEIRPLALGPYTITLQLDNPHMQEPFVLYLGTVEFVRSQQPSAARQPFRLTDLWDGSILDKFLQRCASDPSFEPLLATRMLWGEVLVSLFSVSYCTAVTWLGPLDFTNWQLRAYQLSCVTGIFFQCIFLAWCASVITTELAFPLALSIALIYFSAFNITNVLILLERDDAFPELGGDFSHIRQYPQAAALRVLLHAKRARWH